MKFPRTILFTAVIVAASSEAAFKTGPGIGDVIPAFSLPDQNGKTMNLKSICGPKGAMLVFYRSADW